jgi:cell division protein FtsW
MSNRLTSNKRGVSGGNRSQNAKQTASQTLSRMQRIFDRVFKAQSIHFYRLLGVTLFLVGFGVIMVLSASSIDSLKANNNSFSIFNKQFFFAILGLLGMSLISLMPTSFFRSKASFFFRIAMILQIAVFFIGEEINGNKNWISVFGLFTIQPSEFLKVAVVLFVASHLASNVDYFYDQSIWMKAIFVSGVAMAAVMVGKDLGTVIIMAIMFIGMMILAGMPQKLITWIFAAAAVLLPLALSGSASRWGRIMAWLNPNAPDPNGYNWQSEHGMWALSAGRVFGAGLGESKMKWSWIPEVENDFIFAIIGEELGLVGALVVIALFGALAIFFLNIYNRTDDKFSKYVVGAIMLWIVFQAIVNIAVVLRLLPVLGVPLPLISAGGSSLVATLAGIGIVLAIERENHSRPATVRRAAPRRR